jgi:hypothetical protein
VNGKWQIFAGGGDGVLYALDSEPRKAEDSSFLRKVWWFDANPPEYKVKDGKPIKYPAAEGPSSEINATPVFYKNRVYVPIGQDPEHGEGVAGWCASIRPRPATSPERLDLGLQGHPPQHFHGVDRSRDRPALRR